MLDDIQFVIGKLKAVVVQESRPEANRLRASCSTASVDEGDSGLDHSVDEQMRKSREKIIHTLTNIQKILGQFCFCKLPFGSPVVKEVTLFYLLFSLVCPSRVCNPFT